MVIWIVVGVVVALAGWAFGRVVTGSPTGRSGARSGSPRGRSRTTTTPVAPTSAVRS